MLSGLGESACRVTDRTNFAWQDTTLPRLRQVCRCKLSLQNENVRFEQSRNVRFYRAAKVELPAWRGGMETYPSAAVDETKLPEFIHESVDATARRSRQFGRGFL